jgi:hypothetical protein
LYQQIKRKLSNYILGFIKILFGQNKCGSYNPCHESKLLEGLTIINYIFNLKKMKKIMFALAFVGVGLFASASNEVKKETNKLVSKPEGKALSKAGTKLPPGNCYLIEIWTVDCPDGSIGLAAVDVYVVNCDTGAPISGQTVFANTYGDACGD